MSVSKIHPPATPPIYSLEPAAWRQPFELMEQYILCSDHTSLKSWALICSGLGTIASGNLLTKSTITLRMNVGGEWDEHGFLHYIRNVPSQEATEFALKRHTFFSRSVRSLHLVHDTDDLVGEEYWESFLAVIAMQLVNLDRLILEFPCRAPLTSSGSAFRDVQGTFSNVRMLCVKGEAQCIYWGDIFQDIEIMFPNVEHIAYSTLQSRQSPVNGTARLPLKLNYLEADEWIHYLPMRARKMNEVSQHETPRQLVTSSFTLACPTPSDARHGKVTCAEKAEELVLAARHIVTFAPQLLNLVVRLGFHWVDMDDQGSHIWSR